MFALTIIALDIVLALPLINQYKKRDKSNTHR